MSVPGAALFGFGLDEFQRVMVEASMVNGAADTDDYTVSSDVNCGMQQVTFQTKDPSTPLTVTQVLDGLTDVKGPVTIAAYASGLSSFSGFTQAVTQATSCSGQRVLAVSAGAIYNMHADNGPAALPSQPNGTALAVLPLNKMVLAVTSTGVWVQFDRFDGAWEQIKWLEEGEVISAASAVLQDHVCAFTYLVGNDLHVFGMNVRDRALYDEGVMFDIGVVQVTNLAVHQGAPVLVNNTSNELYRFNGGQWKTRTATNAGDTISVAHDKIYSQVGTDLRLWDDASGAFESFATVGSSVRVIPSLYNDDLIEVSDTVHSIGDVDFGTILTNAVYHTCDTGYLVTCDQGLYQVRHDEVRTYTVYPPNSNHTF